MVSIHYYIPSWQIVKRIAYVYAQSYLFCFRTSEPFIMKELTK